MCAPSPMGLRRSLEDGRRAVSMIVGRDTRELDEAAVARAAIESAAENLSDGVVAPAFWFLVGGSARHIVIQDREHRRLHDRAPDRAARGFRMGRSASGRCTQLASRPPDGMPHRRDRFDLGALRTAARDGPSHRSVNAGWPEAAMAHRLGLALSGPRSYAGEMTTDAILNAGGRREATAQDIDAATGVLWRVWGAVFLTTLIPAAI
jgi:adenosylcobinamide-phosphate synthase